MVFLWHSFMVFLTIPYFFRHGRNPTQAQTINWAQISMGLYLALIYKHVISCSGPTIIKWRPSYISRTPKHRHGELGQFYILLSCFEYINFQPACNSSGLWQFLYCQSILYHYRLIHVAYSVDVHILLFSSPFLQSLQTILYDMVQQF